MRAVARPALLAGSRVGAAAALVVAVGHLPGAMADLRAAPVVAALLLALALGCTHCAVGLWRRPCARTWWVALGMGVGMLLAHRLMPASGAGMTGMTGMAGEPLSHRSPLEVVAMPAQGLLLGLAAVALLRTYRGRGLSLMR